MIVNVILLKSVNLLGTVSDIVPVKLGYAKNYLVKMGYAVLANKKNIAEIESKKLELKSADEKHKKIAQDFKNACGDVSIVLKKSAIQNGRLYGSVSTKEISDALVQTCIAMSGDQNATSLIKPSSIRVSNDIKYLGEYRASVVLYGDVSLLFSISVESNA